MKNIPILILALLYGLESGAGGQTPSPDHLLEQVLESNLALQTAQDAYRASVLEAATGNAPPDPDMELGYLFGKPSEMGNRIDFSVTQQVEFPTIYLHRSRLKKIRADKAELEFQLTRQQVLLQAKKLWIERIHLNQLKNLMEERLRQADQIHAHFREKLNAGEVAQMVFSQAKLQLASLQGEIAEIHSDIKINELSINEIAGGRDVEINDTLFPLPVRILPDTLFEKYRENPEFLLYQNEMRLKQQEKSLTVSQRLPRLSTGYYSESVLDQQFRGFQVGFSVPLWENSNKIRQAESEVIYAETDAGRYAIQQKQELLQKLDRLESLKSRSDNLEMALDNGKGFEFLTATLKSGEISLTEYFYASDFYFRNEHQLLQYKMEILMIEAELLKVYL